ncbi:MAG: GNAT family N-acetyltransferase [Stenomitos frigidus ULC029]
MPETRLAMPQRSHAPRSQQSDKDEETSLQHRAVVSSGGRTIPAPLRTQMESAFNANFANVKIHEGNHVGSVGAIAYTQGDRIHFAPGRFNPDTRSGQALLGHELAHVVQQRQGRVKPTTQVNGLPVNDQSALEQEADVLGQKATQMKPSATLQRQETQDTANYQITSPKASTDGYREITAVNDTTNQAIGTVKIKGASDRSQLQIADLWVDPAHRQQGISKSLIAAANQEGKKSGHKKTRLGVDPEAPGMSTSTLQGIYARQGFKRSGNVKSGQPLMETEL